MALGLWTEKVEPGSNRLALETLNEEEQQQGIETPLRKKSADFEDFGNRLNCQFIAAAAMAP